MSTPKRKIGFYSLRLVDTENNENFHNPSELKPIINFISSLNGNEKIYDIPTSNKFHLLEEVISQDDIQKLVFASAKYYHRPPLINKDTAEERENPKELFEGESELTHVAMKYLENEIILIMEERKVGISINAIKNYFTQYAVKYLENNNRELEYDIEYSIIPKGNFLEELENLRRVQFGNIYIDKQILGSEFLNFSDRIEEIQENLTLTVKAKRKRSAKDLIREIFNSFTSGRNNIRKIRVYGYSNEGNQVLLDTDIVKKIEYVTVDLEESTGIVSGNDIFSSFTQILAEYED